MSKILITGITGFIGGELAHRFYRSHEVHGIVKPSRSRDYSSLEDIENNITLHELDISDYAAVVNLFDRLQPEIIIHLAALSPVRASFDNPFDYIRVNVDGTVNIVEALQKLPNPNERRLVFASTAEVYGLQDECVPFTEDMRLEPSSPYACTKVFADTYIRMKHEVQGLNCTIMRCVNTFGRKYDKSFFIEYLIDQMLNDRDIHIGAPNSIRDYMWVEDHLNAYELAITKEEARGEIFNAATGNGVSNLQAASLLAELAGYDKNRIHTDSYPIDYPTRPLASDQPYLVLSASKIKRKLGWPEPLDLNTSLARALDYWRIQK